MATILIIDGCSALSPEEKSAEWEALFERGEGMESEHGASEEVFTFKLRNGWKLEIREGWEWESEGSCQLTSPRSPCLSNNNEWVDGSGPPRLPALELISFPSTQSLSLSLQTLDILFYSILDPYIVWYWVSVYVIMHSLSLSLSLPCPFPFPDECEDNDGTVVNGDDDRGSGRRVGPDGKSQFNMYRSTLTLEVQ